MGQERPERALTLARLGYAAAARRLRQAMAVWVDLQVPWRPRPDGQLAGWTEQQYRATQAVAQAWTDLVHARRLYHHARAALRRPDR